MFMSATELTGKSKRRAHRTAPPIGVPAPPRYGRFMEVDPIGFAGGMNLYAYAGNDPINFVDPSGLQSQEICYTVRASVQVNNEPPSVGSRRICYRYETSGGPANNSRGGVGGGSGGNPMNWPHGERPVPQPNFCYGPPEGPEGVSASEMAAQSRANGNEAASHSSTDLSWFYSQVRNHGPWDYKQYDRAFQAYGNYNFGYAGARQGIPAAVLRFGAAYAQVRAGTSSWSFAPTDFDDPADREQIDRGIHDAENGC